MTSYLCGKEIDKTYAGLCATLQRTLAWCRDGEAELAGRDDAAAHHERDLLHRERKRMVAEFSRGIIALNKQLADFNLAAPSIHLHRIPFNVERELERLGANDSL